MLSLSACRAVQPWTCPSRILLLNSSCCGLPGWLSHWMLLGLQPSPILWPVVPVAPPPPLFPGALSAAHPLNLRLLEDGLRGDWFGRGLGHKTSATLKTAQVQVLSVPPWSSRGDPLPFFLSAEWLSPLRPTGEGPGRAALWLACVPCLCSRLCSARLPCA